MIGTITGNYKIVEEIGSGGMGKVYRGIELTIDREVAIKALRPELATNENLTNRFRYEAQTLSKLNHPHIATLYSFFRHEDLFLMVLEYVRGEGLEKRISRLGKIPPEDAIQIYKQVLEAIAYAHKRGIIHRDLKPSNVMITDAGEVKVMDFGIARIAGTERITQEGLLIGTLEYMAPEQIRSQDPSPQTDIYSLGIMLYEMLTGRLPFICKTQFEKIRAHIELTPPPPSQFASGIPPHLDAVILRSLRKDTAERFATAEQFLAALLDTSLEATSAGKNQAYTSGFSSPSEVKTGINTFSSLLPDKLMSGPPLALTDTVTVTRPFYLRPLFFGAIGVLAIIIAIIAIFLPRSNPPKYQAEMVKIQGASFQMGRATEPREGTEESYTWWAAQWPSHPVNSGDFEIDRYEVTNEEYAIFINEMNYAPPRDWGGGKNPPAGQEKWPVRNVSFDDALAFASWRSKRDGKEYRLPSEEEWEYAAKGSAKTRYPWGDEWNASRANLSTESPKSVGAYPQGKSQFGVDDMIGNAAEWTRSTASLYPGNNKLNWKVTSTYYVIRGGSYRDSVTGKEPISATSRNWREPSHRDATIGFRLVSASH